MTLQYYVYSGQGAGDSSVVIVVSSISLLLIVSLVTVIFIQCLVILRMRRSAKDVLHSNETETSIHEDVPVTANEAYVLHKIPHSTEEVTYDVVH